MAKGWSVAGNHLRACGYTSCEELIKEFTTPKETDNAILRAEPFGEDERSRYRKAIIPENIRAGFRFKKSEYGIYRTARKSDDSE